MALMYPATPEFKHSSEETVYELIKAELSNQYVCYFNYVIQKKEFDIAILVPGRGIAVLEIKGWSADQVLEIPDNNTILYRLKSGVQMPYQSPLKQANRYRFAFRNRIELELDKNVLVIPVVCYPLITREQYNEKRLDIISSPELTLLKEDMGKSLESRIEELFDEFTHMDVDPFDKSTMRSVRLFFESEKQVDETMPQEKETSVQAVLAKKRTCYSQLQYVPAQMDRDAFDKLCEQLITLWCEGTKILFISEEVEKIRLIQASLHETLIARRLNNLLHFKDDDDAFKSSIFNFSFYQVDKGLGQSFSIVDGLKWESYGKLLAIVDQQTIFNLNQYKIEHAPIDENISIRAGAGSGKTFSMISRISFLIYAHGLTPETLKEAIYLITFTNESAINMKIRLQDYLLNYFLVTTDYQAFQMIESIEDMKIATIHSLVKRILVKFSAGLGLGQQLSIATGKYERDQELAAILDAYCKEHQLNPSNMNLTMYHLQRRIRTIMEKLDSKNIDLSGNSIDYGQSFLPAFDQLLRKLPALTENNTRDHFDRLNKVRLSDLMIRLKHLITNDAEPLAIYRNKIKYVFVDEFQDTDDVQISLMNEIQRIIGYNYFVVGDIKQCIYRFRGAEVKAFDQLTKSNDKWGQEYSLNKNYRSDRLLLERFEKSFDSWGRGESPRLVYQSEQDRLTSRIELNTPNDQYFEEVETNESGFEEHFISKLKKLYELMPSDGTLAVLVRENNQVDRIRRFGLKHQMLIETDVGGNLYRLEPTLDLYKLVLALQHSTSPKYLLNLYTTSYVDQPIPKREMYAKRKDPDQMLRLFGEASFIPSWEKYLQDLKREPVLFVLREIMLDTKPWEKYAQKLNFPAHEQLKLQKYYKRNLDLLFEQLSKIGNGDYLTINTIERFLHIMIMTKQSEESREDVQVIEGQGKRIVCMTVHKSKGLEFHTVMLPFTNQDLEGQKKSGPVEVIVLGDETVGYRVGFKVLLDEPLGKYKVLTNDIYRSERKKEKEERIHEETRILYVALTRTVRHFTYFYYIDCADPVTWQNMIREARA